MAQPTPTLTDEDVRHHLDMGAAVAVMAGALGSLAEGTLVAPARSSLDTPGGSLVFTSGAEIGQAGVIGFRVYGTFGRPSGAPAESQIVAVYDYHTGALKGLVVGRLLGAMRTGALGGVAIQHMARPGADSLAVIGAGYQARTQVAAAMAVRPIRSVFLYSRTQASAERLGAEIVGQYGVDCRVCSSAEEAVGQAAIIIGATNSRQPVLETGWVRPGSHVSTIGPKQRGAQEMPPDLADAAAVVASDSLAQVRAYGDSFFVDPDRIVGLDQIVAGRLPGRRNDQEITLFCSVGLAGTEVLLADALLSRVSG